MSRFSSRGRGAAKERAPRQWKAPKVTPPKRGEPATAQEKIDVYEVFGSCANSRGWDFLVCRTLSNALEHIGDSLDSLEEGEEVRIIFRRYTQDQMDEVIYE